MSVTGRYVLELTCDNPDCAHTHYDRDSIVQQGHKSIFEAPDREAALKQARRAGWKFSSTAHCPVCKC